MALQQFADFINAAPHFLDGIGVHFEFAGNLGNEVASYLQHLKRVSAHEVLFGKKPGQDRPVN